LDNSLELDVTSEPHINIHTEIAAISGYQYGMNRHHNIVRVSQELSKNV